MEKVDYKKELKELYAPKNVPSIVDVPPMRFVMVDGSGGPDSSEYAESISIVYSISYTIKMNGRGSDGYFEYVVPPLEGLWWTDAGESDTDRDSWKWTSMIRLPEFVTPELFAWAVNICRNKNPQYDYSRARFETYIEGLCVQVMHTGPYSDEAASVEKIRAFIEENALVDLTAKGRRHHEIYLSDPNKTKPENLKTVLRFPVSRKD